MARMRKLDKGVTIFVDRHGKERTRFRLQGMNCYLPHPATPEYKEAYQQAISGTKPMVGRIHPRSVGDLVQRFYASNRFNAKAQEDWKRTVKQVLEPFRHEARDVPVADFTFEHIETLLRRVAVKRKEDKKTVGGSFAAERLREQLIRLFAYAIRLGWIDQNPAKEAELPVAHEVKGFHAWTLGELIQFDAKHQFGTKARLAKEIAFWTGLRRGDVATLTVEECRGGRIDTTASKTKKPVNVKIAGPLKAAMDAVALPEKGAILRTEYGKPFAVAGFGNWFKDRCKEAGLPHCTIHGLRKGFTTLAAEAGSTQQELKAYGQWSHDSEVATYAKNASQKLLADSAVSRVEQMWTLANSAEKVSQNDVPCREKIS
jgi:integrase